MGFVFYTSTHSSPGNLHSLSQPSIFPPLLPPLSLGHASIDPCPFQNRLDTQDPQHQVVAQAGWGEKVDLGAERKGGREVICGWL